MNNNERLRAISDIIARWVNEPYAQVGDGMAGPPERQYLDEILDVLASESETSEKARTP
jgi:hypothetical protein